MRALVLASLVVIVPATALAQDWLAAAAARFPAGSRPTIAASRMAHESPTFVEARVLVAPGSRFAVVAARHRLPRERYQSMSATVPYGGGTVQIDELAYGPGWLVIRVSDHREDVHVLARDRGGALVHVLTYVAHGDGVRASTRWAPETRTLVLTEHYASAPGSGCLERPARSTVYRWDGETLALVSRDDLPPGCP